MKNLNAPGLSRFRSMVHVNSSRYGATIHRPGVACSIIRWVAVALVASGIVAGNADPAVPTSEALRLGIVQLGQSGSVELELSAAQQGSFVIETSSNLVDWISVGTNDLSEGFLSARTTLRADTECLFFRARQEIDPTRRTSLKSLAAATQDSALPFRYTVTGSALESWIEQVREQRAYQSLPVGNSRKWSLFTAVRDEPVDLKLRATVSGTTAAVKVWELGSFDERNLIASLACQVGPWDWECQSSQRLNLRTFKRYEWELTVTGSSSFGDGSAELVGYRQIPRSVIVNGTPYGKASTITRAESPKDVGGFSVVFTPTHGGTISNKRFHVTSSNSDVTVKFSDTQTPDTSSETAHIIATTTRGCGDCNHNGIDDCVEIANGSVTDCNGNLIPDDCELGDPAVIYVDINNTRCQNGSEAYPFKTVQNSYVKATTGDILRIRSGRYLERLTLSRAVRLEAIGGLVSLGQ